MKEVRVVSTVVLWMIVTLVIGLRACLRGIRLAWRLPQAFRKEARCPRGHRVPLYGTYACGACGARFDGAAFAPCPSCSALARHIACSRCGLTIRDPLS